MPVEEDMSDDEGAEGAADEGDLEDDSIHAFEGHSGERSRPWLAGWLLPAAA